MEMEKYPNDDWPDKVMLFLSKWSRPFAEEWFKLMGWLLIISALSFGAQQVNTPILYVVLAISFIALWLHLMIGYHALWHKKSERFCTDTSLSPKALLKTFAVGAPISILITFFTSFIVWLAWQFATKLAIILNR